jgi:hypothetical protein
VIICDLDLSIAQGDPFTVHFTSNTVGVFSDGDTMHETLLRELEWVDPYFDRDAYRDISAISDELIYGSVTGILQLYHIVVRHPHFQADAFNMSLAAYLTYCFSNRVFERMHLKPHINTPGDDISLAETELEIATHFGRGYRMLLVPGESRPPLFITTSGKHASLLHTACERSSSRARKGIKDRPSRAMPRRMTWAYHRRGLGR